MVPDGKTEETEAGHRGPAIRQVSNDTDGVVSCLLLSDWALFFQCLEWEPLFGKKQDRFRLKRSGFLRKGKRHM